MGYTPETPFDSIESAHDFMELLHETVEDVRRDVEADVEAARGTRASRREEALLMVAHKLERLSFHTARSRRLLNDLRTLRRLLLDERSIDEAVNDLRRAASGD